MHCCCCVTAAALLLRRYTSLLLRLCCVSAASLLLRHCCSRPQLPHDLQRAAQGQCSPCPLIRRYVRSLLTVGSASLRASRGRRHEVSCICTQTNARSEMESRASDARRKRRYMPTARRSPADTMRSGRALPRRARTRTRTGRTFSEAGCHDREEDCRREAHAARQVSAGSPGGRDPPGFRGGRRRRRGGGAGQRGL